MIQLLKNLGCPLVCTLGNFLAPVLIAAHTANNVDFGDEPEDEVMKVNHKILHAWNYKKNALPRFVRGCVLDCKM